MAQNKNPSIRCKNPLINIVPTPTPKHASFPAHSCSRFLPPRDSLSCPRRPCPPCNATTPFPRPRPRRPCFYYNLDAENASISHPPRRVRRQRCRSIVCSARLQHPFPSPNLLTATLQCRLSRLLPDQPWRPPGPPTRCTFGLPVVHYRSGAAHLHLESTACSQDCGSGC